VNDLGLALANSRRQATTNQLALFRSRDWISTNRMTENSIHEEKM